jgi:hypothetical protein
MIDTKTLERIMDSALYDGKLIHASVKKVNKEPDASGMRVAYIDPYSDAASLLLKMEWDMTLYVPIGTYRHSTPAFYAPDYKAMRFKWFVYATGRLNVHAKNSGIQFRADWKSFEFGISLESMDPKSRNPKGVFLWASCLIMAEQSRSIAVGEEPMLELSEIKDEDLP